MGTVLRHAAVFHSAQDEDDEKGGGECVAVWTQSDGCPISRFGCSTPSKDLERTAAVAARVLNEGQFAPMMRVLSSVATCYLTPIKTSPVVRKSIIFSLFLLAIKYYRRVGNKAFLSWLNSIVFLSIRTHHPFPLSHAPTSPIPLVGPEAHRLQRAIPTGSAYVHHAIAPAHLPGELLGIEGRGRFPAQSGESDGSWGGRGRAQGRLET